jgi:large subunit ribosomal protein L9
MEIILLEKITNLGALGDKVTVKAGYARNYLFPQNKATRATAANLEMFEARRVELEQASADQLTRAQGRLSGLEGCLVAIAANASPEGKLFGSVGPAEIAEAITAQGQEVEKREVQMPDGPIRNIGEFEVVVRLHSDIETKVRVNVVVAE